MTIQELITIRKEMGVRAVDVALAKEYKWAKMTRDQLYEFISEYRRVMGMSNTPFTNKIATPTNTMVVRVIKLSKQLKT